MSYYWDSPSVPTTAGQQLVRMPSPPTSPWEYAQLQDTLRPGGRAPAVIMRPDSNGQMQATDTVVDVYVYMLPFGQSLAYGATVEINWHTPSNKWWVTNWKCGT
jgi:hypothetical protein